MIPSYHVFDITTIAEKSSWDRPADFPGSFYVLVDGVLCHAAKDAHELAEKLRGLHQRAVARVRTSSIDKSDLPRTSYRTLPEMRQDAHAPVTATSDEIPPPRPAKPAQPQGIAAKTPPPRPLSSKPRIQAKAEPDQQEAPPIAPYASKFATTPATSQTVNSGAAGPNVKASPEEASLAQHSTQALPIGDKHEGLAAPLTPFDAASTTTAVSTNPFSEGAAGTGGSSEAVVSVTIQGNVIELDGEFFGFAESSSASDVQHDEEDKQVSIAQVTVDVALAKIETAFDFLATIEAADVSSAVDMFAFLPPPLPELLEGAAARSTSAFVIPAPPPEPDETPVRKASSRSIGRMVSDVPMYAYDSRTQSADGEEQLDSSVLVRKKSELRKTPEQRKRRPLSSAGPIFAELALRIEARRRGIKDVSESESEGEW